MTENGVPAIVPAMATDAPSVSADLTPRQARFAELYVEGLPAADAYASAYACVGSSRATVRVNAFRLLRQPKIARRVQELQDAASSRATRSTAALVGELEEMVAADISEVMRLDVGACRYCWSDPPGSYHWRDEAELAKAADAWLASLSTPKPLPAPDTKGSMGYSASATPNPDCCQCAGAGIPRAIFNSTADCSPAARRLIRGVELFPDGSVKRLLMHDQTQLRIELHKLRGLHVDRSVNLNANIDLPTPQNVSAQDVLDLWKSTR